MPLDQLDPLTLGLAAAILFAGGFAKGVTAIALPVIAVSLLSLVVPVWAVMPVLILPFIVTNIWQAVASRRVRETFMRFRVLFAGTLLSSYVAARYAHHVDVRVLYAVIGFAVLAFLAASRLRGRLVISPAWERRLALPIGLGAGVIGGPTGIYGPQLTLWFDALRVDKEGFVAAFGVMMSINTVAILIALILAGRFAMPEAVTSTLAILPVAIGMAIGQRIRHRMDQERFFLVLRIVLFLIAIHLLTRAFL